MEDMTRHTTRFGIDRFALRIIAMTAMLLDHAAILFPGVLWLECVGRMALPIFCFLMVEGFFHTRSVKKYGLRLLLFAAVSQAPYMLCVYRSLAWNGLNVLFTLLAGLTAIAVIHRFRAHKGRYIAALLLVTAAAQCLVQLFRADGCYVTVYMMVCFYIFRDSRLMQLLCMIAINGFFTVSPTLTAITMGGITIPLGIQLLAVSALIPIWLYNGKKGWGNRYAQYGFYAFYPLHLLLLWVIFQMQR